MTKNNYHRTYSVCKITRDGNNIIFFTCDFSFQDLKDRVDYVFASDLTRNQAIELVQSIKTSMSNLEPEKVEVKQAAVTVVYDDNNKILLLERHDYDRTVSGWCLPGGKLDGNETPSECSIRELHEETDLAMNRLDNMTWKYHGTLMSSLPNLQPTQIHIYSIKVVGSPQVKLSDEHKSYRWVDNPANYNLAGSTLNIIKRVTSTW